MLLPVVPPAFEPVLDEPPVPELLDEPPAVPAPEALAPLAPPAPELLDDPPVVPEPEVSDVPEPPDAPVPEVPVPDVPEPAVPVPDVPLPDVPLPDVPLPTVPLPEEPLALPLVPELPPSGAPPGVVRPMLVPADEPRGPLAAAVSLVSVPGLPVVRVAGSLALVLGLGDVLVSGDVPDGVVASE